MPYVCTELSLISSRPGLPPRSHFAHAGAIRRADTGAWRPGIPAVEALGEQRRPGRGRSCTSFDKELVVLLKSAPSSPLSLAFLLLLLVHPLLCSTHRCFFLRAHPRHAIPLKYMLVFLESACVVVRRRREC